MYQRKKILMGLAILLAAGCASPGRDSFDIGREMEKQQRFEDALPLYEDALSKDAENQEYKSAIFSVRQRLVKRLLDSAREQMNASPLRYDNLRSAQIQVGKALKMDKANADAISLSESLKGQSDAMLKKAESAYAQANRAIESKDWIGALELLKGIRSYYPNYLDLVIKIPATEGNAVAFYLKEADRLKTKDDTDGMIKNLEAALALQPSNAQLAAVLKAEKARNNASGNLEKAEKFAKENRWDRAGVYLKRAQLMNPGPAEKERIKKLVDEGTRKLLAKASADLRRKALYTAFIELKSVQEFNPAGSRGVEAVQLRKHLLADMSRKIDALEAAGHLGQALHWAECASELAASRKEFQHKLQLLTGKVRQRVIKKIAIMDFNPPANNTDAGRLVTDSLLSYMTRNASGDVKILARDVLGTLIKEIEMGQAGLYDIESAKKSGKLKGTDVFIFGSLLQYAVEKNVEEGQKMVVAKVGVDKDPNPQYNAWLAANPNPSESDRRNAPPVFIERDRTETIRYKVATHRKNANVTISFRVIDVESGEVVITKTLKSKKEAVGTYSEGVDVAGIPYQRLNLPSDAELLEKAVDDSISDLGHQVLSRFQNLQENYLNAAEVLKKRGDIDAAIEKYVDAVVSEQVKKIKSPVTENAMKELHTLLQMNEQAN